MKWMGGWSQQDYEAASVELIDTIRTMMREEYDEWQSRQR